MKQLIFLFVLQFFTLHLLGQSAYTKTDLNLRTYGSSRSSIIGVIPKGDKVTIQYCNSYWCKVNYQNSYNGFVSKRYLHRQTTNSYITKTPTDRPIVLPQPKVDYYINSFGETVQRPTYYPTPPSGASAVCRDGTYSFSRNRRGTCSYHGGVKKWLSSSTSKTYSSTANLNYTPTVKKPSKTYSRSTAYRSSSAVRCSGITQKGYQCKRRTKSSSGYCWQH